MSQETVQLSDESRERIKKSHEEFEQGAYQHLHRDGGECPECGGTVEKAWNYCGWCGADLTSDGGSS